MFSFRSIGFKNPVTLHLLDHSWGEYDCFKVTNILMLILTEVMNYSCIYQAYPILGNLAMKVVEKEIGFLSDYHLQMSFI